MTRFNPLIDCFSFLLDHYNERRNTKPDEAPEAALDAVVLDWMRLRSRSIEVKEVSGADLMLIASKVLEEDD